MYYVLDRFGALHPCRWVAKYPYIEGANFREGARFTVPIPQPLEITLKPLNPDADDHGPEIPDYLKGKIPLFRNDFIEALKKGGVDNLDLYDAVIIDPDDGKRHTTHKAVNIIGALSVADMGKSEATVHPGGPVIDVDFDSLVVDEKRARGALMFRLAESVNAILVHERLRDHLIASGFNDLEFLEPSDVAL